MKNTFTLAHVGVNTENAEERHPKNFGWRSSRIWRSSAAKLQKGTVRMNGAFENAISG